MNIPTKSELLLRLSIRLRIYIFKDLELSSQRRFARATGMNESRVRDILNISSSGTESMHYAAGPRKKTMEPLLKLNIPEDLRELISDVLDYELRILRPSLLKKQSASIVASNSPPNFI